MPFPSNNVLLSTVEKFNRYDFTNSSGSTVTDYNAVPKGVLFELSLNRGARRHFIWPACGSFAHLYTVRWFAQCCLCFRLNGNLVGEYQFGDASKVINATDRQQAPFAILRTAATGLGSVQPILRYQETQDNTLDRDNLDIGCVALECEADSAQFMVQKVGYVAPNLAVLLMLLGARIVSTR